MHILDMLNVKETLIHKTLRLLRMWQTRALAIGYGLGIPSNPRNDDNGVF